MKPNIYKALTVNLQRIDFNNLRKPSLTNTAYAIQKF